jgi:hypothetical protein
VGVVSGSARIQWIILPLILGRVFEKFGSYFGSRFESFRLFLGLRHTTTSINNTPTPTPLNGM